MGRPYHVGTWGSPFANEAFGTCVVDVGPSHWLGISMKHVRPWWKSGCRDHIFRHTQSQCVIFGALQTNLTSWIPTQRNTSYSEQVFEPRWENWPNPSYCVKQVFRSTPVLRFDQSLDQWSMPMIGLIFVFWIWLAENASTVESHSKKSTLIVL